MLGDCSLSLYSVSSGVLRNRKVYSCSLKGQMLSPLRWTRSSCPYRDMIILRFHQCPGPTIVICVFFTGAADHFHVYQNLILPPTQQPNHRCEDHLVPPCGSLSKHVRGCGFATTRVQGPSHWATPSIVRRVFFQYASLEPSAHQPLTFTLCP